MSDTIDLSYYIFTEETEETKEKEITALLQNYDQGDRGDLLGLLGDCFGGGRVKSFSLFSPVSSVKKY